MLEALLHYKNKVIAVGRKYHKMIRSKNIKMIYMKFKKPKKPIRYLKQKQELNKLFKYSLKS